MIATILLGSSNFHAVGYNDRKVSKGVASLIEILNFGNAGLFGVPTTEEKVSYLQTYTSQNERIKKAQFHMAISCKGHEMTEEQLLDFAHLYLKEMGYMEPGQPILIYAHRDTANTHLHIITSRIGPDGRKIDHSNERRRSQEIIDRLTKIDRGKKVYEDLAKAFSYSFSTPAQFKAVLSSLGYEVYNKEGKYFIKFGGKIRKKIDEQEVVSHYTAKRLANVRQKRLRQTLCKYRDMATDKEDFKKALKEKFGIDLVFFGKTDSPFGYMLIDHSQKEVINGNRLLSLDRLLDFATPEVRLDRMERYVEDILADNPKATLHDIFTLLSKKKAYIKKYRIYYQGESKELRPEIAIKIDRNNKLGWVSRFNPVSESERYLLCRMAKLPEMADEKVALSDDRKVPDKVNQLLSAIYNDPAITNIRKALWDNGYIVKTAGDETFIINMKSKVIVNLTSIGFDISDIQRDHRQRQLADMRGTLNKNYSSGQNHPSQNRTKGLKDAGGGSKTDNREWEVGNGSDIDSVEESKRLKM